MIIVAPPPIAMVGLVDVLLQHQSKFHADHQRLDFVADGGRAVYEFKILPEKLPYFKKTLIHVRQNTLISGATFSPYQVLPQWNGVSIA